MAIKKHEPLSSAKALIAFLVLLIVFVLYWKFQQNLDYFFEDPYALRNYVVAVIVGSGLLIALMYHVSQTTHPKAIAKASKPSKSNRKKK